MGILTSTSKSLAHGFQAAEPGSAAIQSIAHVGCERVTTSISTGDNLSILQVLAGNRRQRASCGTIVSVELGNNSEWLCRVDSTSWAVVTLITLCIRIEPTAVPIAICAAAWMRCKCNGLGIGLQDCEREPISSCRTQLNIRNRWGQLTVHLITAVTSLVGV